MSKDRIHGQNLGINEPSLNQDNLLNYSRQELMELAKNLSSGKYENNSRQRDKILQLLVKQLSNSDTPDNTG